MQRRAHDENHRWPIRDVGGGPLLRAVPAFFGNVEPESDRHGIDDVTSVTAGETGLHRASRAAAATHTSVAIPTTVTEPVPLSRTDPTSGPRLPPP